MYELLKFIKQKTQYRMVTKKEQRILRELLFRITEPTYCKILKKKNLDCDACPAYLKRYADKQHSCCAFDYARQALNDEVMNRNLK
jgi:hypothetical protein